MTATLIAAVLLALYAGCCAWVAWYFSPKAKLHRMMRRMRRNMQEQARLIGEVLLPALRNTADAFAAFGAACRMAQEERTP